MSSLASGRAYAGPPSDPVGALPCPLPLDCLAVAGGAPSISSRNGGIRETGQIGRNLILAFLGRQSKMLHRPLD
eukprot:15424824-Alexandrium_andersonii.AAC.1